MTHNQFGRPRYRAGSTLARLDHSLSAITSRYAALRREQNRAARLLMATEIERGIVPAAICPIAAARDRRTSFVWRTPRRDG